MLPGLIAVIGLAVLVGPSPVWAAVPTLHDIPLPPRSRAEGDDRFASGRGFRDTVTFYQRFFQRTGLPHRAVPPYGYRGVVVARFVSRDARSRWLAVHVFQVQGRTSITIVARPSPTSSGQTPGGS